MLDEYITNKLFGTAGPWFLHFSSTFQYLPFLIHTLSPPATKLKTKTSTKHMWENWGGGKFPKLSDPLNDKGRPVSEILDPPTFKKHKDTPMSFAIFVHSGQFPSTLPSPTVDHCHGSIAYFA